MDVFLCAFKFKEAVQIVPKVVFVLSRSQRCRLKVGFSPSLATHTTVNYFSKKIKYLMYCLRLVFYLLIKIACILRNKCVCMVCF